MFCFYIIHTKSYKRLITSEDTLSGREVDLGYSKGSAEQGVLV